MKKNFHYYPLLTDQWVKKVLLTMRISLFFTLCCVLNVSAGLNVKSQTFDISSKDVSVKEIFRIIESKSDYRFFYNDELSEVNRLVSLNVTGSDVADILAQLFDQSKVAYKILENNLIVIAPKQALQQIKVSGTVTDNTGQPLPGVSIVIQGTTKGTMTSNDGKYSLEVPDVNSVLQFSYLGYVAEERQVGSQTIINVSMNEDVKKLDEVVVVGYGTQKKTDVTGAMIRVSESELKSRPVANAIEALQGKATGVDITSNERPGEVGMINIRGVRSLTASNTPLYVVDGIPVMSTSGIETLNPADIEAIDVLKDASATAIYGSRGANGVVLVTTKRGKSGKMSFNYSGTVTIETLQDRQKMMTADEYLTWRRWAYYYSDVTHTKYPRGDQPTQANDYIIFSGAKDMYAWNNIMRGWAGGTWDGSKVQTTDWTSMVTQTGVSTEHNISASGGTEKIKAYGSFGYLSTQGTQKGQEYTRYSSKASVDLNPVKWFEMGVGVNTTYSIQQFGMSNVGGQVSGPGSIYAAANNNLPYAVPYDSLGNRITYPGGDDMIKTAVGEWNYTTDERKMLRVLGSAYVQLNLLPGLKYRVNFGPDFRYYKNGVYIDAMSVNRVGSPNLASLRNQNDFSWTLDNLIYYDKKIGNHTFGATFLQTASAWNTNYSYMEAIGIPLPSQKWDALNKNNITALNNWDSGLTDRELTSYMGRLNYGFADKYLVTLSGRWDGASQLAAGHKWTFFPSAALAWRVDKEEWLKNIAWVNQLKVRIGVGVTGNAAINPYATKGAVVSLFYPYGSSPTTGYVPSESLITGGNLPLANPNLGWEQTTQYNLGFDFSLLKGRISGVVDLYTSRTTDLLMQMNIPALTGYTTTYANVGETKNKGIDITLNTMNIKAGSFTWETSVNAAYQNDEIVSLANGNDINNLWFTGEALGVIYGYASNGLWHEEDAAEMAKFNANGHSFQVGMARPADLNGDYKIDPNNDRKIIGHTRPRWTVGLSNTFRYKNFDFSFFLYGRMDYTFNTGGEYQGGRYVQRSISYYNENNKNAEYQKPIYNVASGDPYYSILGYRDGSFMKIRDISLGYTLPASIAKKLGLQTVRLYAQAKNPGMLFSKISWLDMDLSNNATWDNTQNKLGTTQSTSTWNRGFVFGLNVGF